MRVMTNLFLKVKDNFEGLCNSETFRRIFLIFFTQLAVSIYQMNTPGQMLGRCLSITVR